MKGLNDQNAEGTAEAQRDSFTFWEGAELFISMAANKGCWQVVLLFVPTVCASVSGIRIEKELAFQLLMYQLCFNFF